MKGLTLSQPWATLVAVGAKKLETRNWRTSYRGPLAIHAGKGLGGIQRPDGGPGREEDLAALIATEPFRTALQEVSIYEAAELPRGQIVAVCSLEAILTTDVYRIAPVGPRNWEAAFGNFAAGRYAWVLRDVVEVQETLPAGTVSDYRGLWDVPASVAAALGAAL